MENNSYEEYIRSVLGYPNVNPQDIYQENNVYRNNQNQYPYYDISNPYNYGNSLENRQEYMETNRNYELEECYPEIYKIVYPMVQKACNNRSGNVTKDDVDKMVEEIYNNIEGNEQYNININVNSNVVETENAQFENRNETNSSIQNRNETNYMAQNRNNSVNINSINANNEPRYFNGKRIVAEPVKQANYKVNTPIEENKKTENIEIQKQLNREVQENTNRETRQCKMCNRGLSDIIRILLLRELIGKPGNNFPGNRPPFPPPFPPPRPPHGRPPFSPYYSF